MPAVNATVNASVNNAAAFGVGIIVYVSPIRQLSSAVRLKVLRASITLFHVAWCKYGFFVRGKRRGTSLN
jgi:hypothetical protein